jgi:hypothetical protein
MLTAQIKVPFPDDLGARAEIAGGQAALGLLTKQVFQKFGLLDAGLSGEAFRLDFDFSVIGDIYINRFHIFSS